MTQLWRLLDTGLADGATNMAIDEAIARAIQAKLAPPTVRFYGWSPACLSLGQAQPVGEIDFEACAALEIDVVRRSTGGRAILHVDELTYSLAAPENDPHVAGDIIQSYRQISAGLLEGLHILNIPGVESNAQPSLIPYDGSHPTSSPSPVCFEAPSHYEITVAGKKLVGSAQMRKGGVLLQHGAMPLVGDITRICQVLTPAPDPARVRARATSVEASLGHVISFEQAAAALAMGFARTLKVSLTPGQLTWQECAWAEELRRDKYGCIEWTKRI